MLRQVPRCAVLGGLLICAFVSFPVAADTSASPAPISKSSVTPREYLGPRLDETLHAGSSIPRKPLPRDASLLAFVLHWNTVAIDASGLDHTPVLPGEDRIYGEQLGPGRASRAMAIVHIAMFDSMVAIRGGYQPYTDIPRVHDSAQASVKAAVAEAACDTLTAMFPSQRDTFERELQESVSQLPRGAAVTLGLSIGADAAKRILEARKNDGSQYDEPRMYEDFVPSEEPGWWRADPISHGAVALGARWGEVKPFVLTSSKQFRAPPPPSMSSDEYAAAFDEVKRLGGDGIATPTERTDEQTFIATFWAYDGTPSLCAPPRLYNQIATKIARQQNSDAMQTARLLALINVSMADAGIVIWDSKFYYQFWRPVTGIRESDAGTGPTGAGDGNPATVGDPMFAPLGAPASNLNGPNFTPPFPSYPSGHAGIGGSLFQVLRRFYEADDVAFTVVSDEFNGVTRDNQGAVRALRPRSFESFSQAEEENGQSRIYLGIHWSFDKTEGIAQGEQVGDYVFDHIYRPVR